MAPELDTKGKSDEPTAVAGAVTCSFCAVTGSLGIARNTLPEPWRPKEEGSIVCGPRAAKTPMATAGLHRIGKLATGNLLKQLTITES